MSTESLALEIICQKLGWAATLKLAVEYAGRWVYVPEKVDSEHRLFKTLGERAFKQLVALHGGESVHIPLCASAQRLGMAKVARRLRGANFSLWFVAEFLDVSERQAAYLLDVAGQVEEESEALPPLSENVRRMLTAGIDETCKHAGGSKF
jgi:hypothetical protein